MLMMNCPFVEFKEVFKTEQGTVMQCNRRNCYWLDFAGCQTAFRVSDFFAFKKEVDAIDLQAMVEDLSPGADVAVVMPAGCSRCYLLDIQAVLDLRELLAGAKYMIELNRLLRSCALCCQPDQIEKPVL